MKNQRENQVQTKSAGSNVLIIILILIILATSAFGIFAWARYQTSVQGEGTAQVAQWNFKVTGDTTQTEQVVFAVTRDDGNTTVADGMLAPGTSGKIEMAIDVTGTQTDLIYTISGSTVNMPRNLKLYYDESRTQEMVVVNQQFSKGNYLKVADIGTESKIIPETIYWEWPFETGTTDEDKQFNNQIDTEDMGKAMTMAITVEGKQLNDAPVLADLVQVGDYVNYEADSNGTQTFTSADSADLAGTSISGTISTTDNFDDNAKAQWRVLSVNRQTKEIELISVAPTAQTVTLTGGDGFVNAETILNKVSLIYGNGKGARTARSIKLNDIEQYSTYNPETYVTGNGIPYGTSKEYSNGNYYVQTVDDSGVVTGYSTMITNATLESPITMVQDYYYYKNRGYFSDKVLSILFENRMTSYWLASRAVQLDGSYVDYRIYHIVSGGVYGKYVYASFTGGNYSDVRNVVPVVELNNNIKTTGKVNDVWQLKVD